jgi:2,5-diketo-D-gluconate reductase A
VSLKWQVQQGIPVIPKAKNPLYIKQNMDLFSWELSAEDMVALSAATSPSVAGGAVGPPATSGDCSIH